MLSAADAPPLGDRLSALSGDVVAGIVVAILSLPMTIPLGVLALSPLGPDYRTVGVIAGFHSSIFAGFVSALTGGSALQISGPRASVSFIMAAAIALALKDPQLANLGMSKEAAALGLGFVVVALAGLVQIAMGLLKIGRAIKFVPYPVLSGFTNGVGALILLGQLPAALGLTESLHWDNWQQILSGALPAAAAVSLVTILAMWGAPKVTKTIPPIIVALIAGLVFDQVLRAVLGPERLGPVVGAIDGGLPKPLAFLLPPWPVGIGPLLLRQIPNVLILALVGSLESLLSAATLDSMFKTRHDGNRELIGQGLGNIAAALFGGVASTGAPARGLTSYRVGGRTRLAGMIHSVVLFVALLWGGPVLAVIPYSVMAGIMIMVGISLADGWILTLLRRGGTAFLWEALVVVTVAATSLFADLAVAVAVGFALAVFLFFKRMSRPIVRRRRVFDRTVGQSRCIRSSAVEKVLAEENRRIIIIHLDGPIFFGTASFLYGEFERVLASRPRVVILNAAAVSHIDLSGVRVLEDLAHFGESEGCALFLSGIFPNAGRVQWLKKTGIDAAIPENHWFPSLTRAMEAAEDLVACEKGVDVAAPVRLEEMDLVRGLSAQDIDALRGFLDLQSRRQGELIFRQGDQGDGLYFTAAGAIDIMMPRGGERRAVRLATFGPGTFFGESALLAGGTRSADAIARTDAELWFMSERVFARYRARHPRAAAQLYANIAAEIGLRLRMANTRLQVAE